SLLYFHFASYSSVIIFPYFFSFTSTTLSYIYTLSLHDALPILIPHADFLPSIHPVSSSIRFYHELYILFLPVSAPPSVFPHKKGDRKSTRLNSSHVSISYAVFCLKKKNTKLTKHAQLTRQVIRI